MSTLTDYIIPFKGLSEGLHEYEFKLNQDFFKNFDGSEVKEGNLTIQVHFTNKPSLLEFEFIINGTVNVLCDRCLDDFGLVIHAKNELNVIISDIEIDSTEDIVYISKSESEFDLSQYIYEYVILAIPYKKVHENKKDCNQETLKKVEELEIHENKIEITDPRWNILKDLLTNNN